MRIVLAAALAAIVGCSSTTGPQVNRVVGTIAGYTSLDPRIDIGVDGRSISARILTYGAPCDSAADTEIRQSGLVAEVTVYDYRGDCGQRILVTIERNVTIRFPEGGTARLVVHGRDASTRSSRNQTGDLITAAREIVLK